MNTFIVGFTWHGNEKLQVARGRERGRGKAKHIYQYFIPHTKRTHALRGAPTIWHPEKPQIKQYTITWDHRLDFLFRPLDLVFVMPAVYAAGVSFYLEILRSIDSIEGFQMRAIRVQFDLLVLS